MNPYLVRQLWLPSLLLATGLVISLGGVLRFLLWQRDKQKKWQERQSALQQIVFHPLWDVPFNVGEQQCFDRLLELHYCLCLTVPMPAHCFA